MQTVEVMMLNKDKFMGNSVSSREKEHFNAIAFEYENNYHLNDPAAKRKILRLCEEYSECLNLSPEGPLLEIGAGTGFLTRHLYNLIKNRDYIASDISPEMLKIAKSTLSGKNNSVQWKVEDCLSYSFSNSSISAITGHGILHHLDLEVAIKEISRILKPQGRIAFYEPNILNPYVFLIKKIPFLRPAGDTEDETAINPFKLNKLLKKYNFRKISIVPCEFTLNNTPDKLIVLFENFSRFLEKIPVVKYLGGSFRIKAEKI